MWALYYHLSCCLLCIQTVLVELSLKVHFTSESHAHCQCRWVWPSAQRFMNTRADEWNTWGSDHRSAQVKTKEVPARKIWHGHVLPKKYKFTKFIYKLCFGVYHCFAYSTTHTVQHTQMNRNNSLKNLNFLNMYLDSGHLRFRLVCVFIWRDLENLLTSEWVPSKWESRQLIKPSQ